MARHADSSGPRSRRHSGKWYAMALLLCMPLAAAQEPPAPSVTREPPSVTREPPALSREAPSGPREAPALSEEALPAGPAPQLDWVPIERLPEGPRDLRCELCGGRYVDPQADSALRDPARAPIEARAQRSELEGDTVRLRGGVEVTQGYRRLAGDSVDINRRSRAGALSGNIVLREPGVLLRGDRGDYDARSGNAALVDGEFVLHRKHLRGRAARLSRDAENIVRIDEGAVTFCAPGNDDWTLQARRIRLDVDDGVGVARGATLRSRDTPLLYLPWVSFPIDDRRRSGLLFPSLGSDSRGGIDFGVPVYLDLAPHYDLLYVPRFIGERGLNHELQGRYLDPWRGRWQVGGSYIADDGEFLQDFPGETDGQRWLVDVRHNGLYAGRWRSQIQYTQVSDPDFIRDLETSRLDTRRDVNLLQLGQLDYLGERWLLSLQAQQFQPLAEDIREDYKKLPQFTAQYRDAGRSFAVNPLALLQYSNFESDRETVTGQRLYAEAGLSYPMSWSWGFLRPMAKYRLLEYRLDRPPRESELSDRPGAQSALAAVDAGLFFERDTRLAGRDVVQTLEPRLYYLYSQFDRQAEQPDFDSAELTFNYNQLFRDTRFSGRDRLDDANRLSIGLTTRFLDRDTGEERFNASIGQIIYFTNRRVRLNASDPELDRANSELAGEFNFYPSERLSVRSNLQYDPSEERMNAGNILASYTRGNRAVFNIGYTYRRPVTLVGNQPVTEQSHLSAFYPVSRHWRVFAAWNYSLEADRSVEDMIGIEYDSCCWRIRLLHLRYFDTARGQLPDFDSPELDREYATQVQFQLKGLGGFGTGVEELLGDMIRGFNRLAYTAQ